MRCLTTTIFDGWLEAGIVARKADYDKFGGRMALPSLIVAGGDWILGAGMGSTAAAVCSAWFGPDCARARIAKVTSNPVSNKVIRD
jgi:hypothetical protein